MSFKAGTTAINHGTAQISDGAARLHHGAHRVRGWIFCFALGGCPLVYSFQFTSFLHPKEILLLACLFAMGMCTVAARKDKHSLALRHANPWTKLFAPAIPLLLFLGFVFPGAAVPEYVFQSAVPLLAFYLLAVVGHDLVADARWRERFWNAAIFSGVWVALLGLGQYVGVLEFMFPVFPGYTQPVYSVFGNQNLLGAYLAIILPMLLHRILERRHTPPTLAVLLAAFALLLCVLVLSGTRSAWLAAGVGLGLMLWWNRGRMHTKAHLLPLAAVGVLVALLNFPLLWSRMAGTLASGDVGGRARLWFWDGALRMIADHPWAGVGLGNYKYWSPYYQGAALEAPGGEAHFHNTLHTVHAHNEYLEFIAETGAVGGGLLLVFLTLLARGRGVEWIPLATLAICAAFNAVLHSAPHLLLGFLFCTALFTPQTHQPLSKAGRIRLAVAPALEIALMLAVVLGGIALYTSSHLQARAERAHVQRGADMLALYAAAHEKLFRPNYTLYESHGIALLEHGEAKAAMRMFMQAREGLDTGRIHYLLGNTALELGKIDDAIRHYQAALFRWPGEQAVFDVLWALTPDERRGALRQHTARFGLEQPGRGEN